MFTEPTNDDRRCWASEALYAYQCTRGSEDDYTDIKDLLSDLMHLADGFKLDFDAMLNGARMNYEAEKQEADAMKDEEQSR